MNIFEVIKTRRSVRSYKQDEIEQEKLNRVLEAVRQAPSAHNDQPWKFIVVGDERLRWKVAEAASGQMFIAEAPVLIVACGILSESQGQMGGYMDSWSVDVTIAFEHLILQAWAEGLGTCWIGAFDEQEVKAILMIPKGVRVLALTPLGYPRKIIDGGSRKSLEEIVSYDKF